MSLGKRHWGAGFDPYCPYESSLLKRRKFYGPCMPCTSRVPDTRAISGQGMAKTTTAAVTVQRFDVIG
jgi:hypothetical protein